MSIRGISIIGSAARPENWEASYESIGDNEIPFEVIFVGPNEPKFDMPDNFRFIKSNTKPTQCVEIASRAAIYPLLMMFGDDIRFVTDHPLDNLYETYTKNDDDLTMVSCRYQPGGEARTQIDHRFFPGDSDSPLLPFCTLMPTEIWRDLGGVDSRFIASCWDLDIAMRVLAIGGKVVFSNVEVVEDTTWSRGSNLLRDHRSTDLVLARQMWSEDQKTHFNRALPVEPFSDEGILIKSQGPPGRWTHEGDLMNKVITSSTYYRLRSWKTGISGRLHRFRVREVPRYVRRALRRTRS